MDVNTDRHLLNVKLDDVRVILTMLKTIHFRESAMVSDTQLVIKFIMILSYIVYYDS